MDNIVLFGAGVYAKKYYSLLEYLNIEFKYFTDNNKSIHGQLLFGKEVIPPEKLKDIDCRIIISCTHGESIRKQLREMGIEDRIIDIRELYQLVTKSEIDKSKVLHIKNQKVNVLIDMYEGIGWGGTEIWAASVANSLYDKAYNVALWGSTTQAPLDTIYETHVRRFTTEKTIEEMVISIKENLPCVVFNNFAGCMFIAAALVKAQYPQLVKIISVIHNDNKSLYDAHMMLKESIDDYVCVSQKIKDTIITNYGISKEKVHFKEQPIAYDKVFNKTYSECNKPIQIGYAARLVMQQKRADLFPILIKEMEIRNINYILEIAGDGDCYSDIQQYISENHLEHKIKLLGRIDKTQMTRFWRRQDIFLNFSEYEGTSLSMLEAMSNGCVPIVTDVSGAREFIQEGKNGFICEVGDLSNIAKRIAFLEKHRGLLVEYGRLCRHEIQTRCNERDYTTYIENLIQES